MYGGANATQHGQICSRLAMHIRLQRNIRARAVVRIVLASVPHLVFASFLSIEFLELTLALVLAMLILIGEGAVQGDTQIDWLVGVC